MGPFVVSLPSVSAHDPLETALRFAPLPERTVESVGLIAVAVLCVAKFLLEEEIIGDRELRSVPEARRSLTMFVIIAPSLEAVVLIPATELGNVRDLLYPMAPTAVTVLGLRSSA